MFLPLYLAMTPSEIGVASALPPKMGWLACHFSSAHRGLSNLPTALPAGSMVVLDDWIAFDDHDFLRIQEDLEKVVSGFDCSGVLLDFQRSETPEVANLCRQLTEHLPCPVGVPERYAKNLSCPVFLSLPDLHTPLKDCIDRWPGREIWLEAAIGAELATITEEGCSMESCELEKLPDPWHKDDALHCRYHWYQEGDRVKFLLHRTWEDLQELLEEAASLGVARAIGLYQQLHK